MRFALSEEQRQFAASLDDLLSDVDIPALARNWAAGGHDQGLRLRSSLAELGVTGLAVPERWDGIGADAVDLVVAFERLGYHGVPGPWVESAAVLPVLLGGLDDTDAADRWLPVLAGGEAFGTVTVDPHVPYALDADVAELRIALNGAEIREFPAPTGDPLVSVDPTRRLYRAAAGTVLTDAPGSAALAFDTGSLVTAAQLLGAGQWLLDTSVAYAKQREQYGKPIGQYQSIKHLLADVATELELARPLVHGGAVSIATDPAGAARDVSAAKVATAKAAHLAARTGLQVHGAIGFTAEHPLGLWLTKVRALVPAWGGTALHRRRVLDAVLRSREALR